MASPQILSRLRKKGWTVERAISSPDEKWPVPSPPFPPNRFYHFLDNREMALIVSGNEIVASVPGSEAWEMLEQFSPDLIHGEGQPRAERKSFVIKHQGHPARVLESADLSAPWMVQTACTNRGVWTVHAVRNSGGAILLDSNLVRTYDDPSELEQDTEVPPIVVEAAWLIHDEKER